MIPDAITREIRDPTEVPLRVLLYQTERLWQAAQECLRIVNNRDAQRLNCRESGMNMVERLAGALKRALTLEHNVAKTLPHAKKVVLSVPGWISVELEPNVAEQRAAWLLYVEISTRVASQPFNREAGRLRAALSSLYSLFEFTRQILRDAGPDVAHGPKSLGPVAISFLTEVVAPFTTKWNETLAAYEKSRPDGRGELEHEHLWDRFEECCVDLAALQHKVSAYRAALSALSYV
jgi:hypothetical protein